MDSGEADTANEKGGAGGDGALAFQVPVTCSICLEAVKDCGGERSTARLLCGHRFHLDCIGSAFNAKGVMQCPNCRKTEKGDWLYPKCCPSFQETSMDDWMYDEELYDQSDSEMASDQEEDSEGEGQEARHGQQRGQGDVAPQVDFQQTETDALGQLLNRLENLESRLDRVEQRFDQLLQTQQQQITMLESIMHYLRPTPPPPPPP